MSTKQPSLPIYSQFQPKHYYIISNVYVCDFCGEITKTLGPRFNIAGSNIKTGEEIKLSLETVINRLKLHFNLTQEQAEARLPELPLLVLHAEPQHHPRCHACAPTTFGLDPLCTQMPLIPNIPTASGGNLSNIGGKPVKKMKVSKKIRLTETQREARKILHAPLADLANLL